MLFTILYEAGCDGESDRSVYQPYGSLVAGSVGSLVAASVGSLVAPSVSVPP